MDYIQALESTAASTHAQTAYPKWSEHHAPPQPQPQRQPQRQNPLKIKNFLNLIHNNI